MKTIKTKRKLSPRVKSNFDKMVSRIEDLENQVESYKEIANAKTNEVE